MPTLDRELSERRTAVSSAEPGGLRFQERNTGLIEPDSRTASEALHNTSEWQLARRVAASRALAKSEFLRGFLLYVCEQQLAGNSHEITEQHIGTRVFNRPPGYNPGEDNIVRNYARLLRKRLDEYFEGEGKAERIRIDIPRGGYVPVFRPWNFQAVSPEPVDLQRNLKIDPPVSTGEEPPAPALVIASAERAVPSVLAPVPWKWLVGGLVAGILLSSVLWLSLGARKQDGARSPAHALWGQLFRRDRNTLIVSADSGLGILENLTGSAVALEDYANGSYLTNVNALPALDSSAINDVRRQRYTSFVDLNVASQLIQLPELVPNRAQMRFARGISTEDLRNSNAILIGSSHTNPWVSLFDKNLNFRLEYTTQVDRSFIVNRNPQGSEQKVYENSTASGTNRTFGAIDYLPSLDGAGHVLIIQGLNMAATQAAADILFDSDTMPAILARASKPDGSLGSFELLIETNSIGANAPSARVIATRFYPR
jgi:hypothetical protein